MFCSWAQNLGFVFGSMEEKYLCTRGEMISLRIMLKRFGQRIGSKMQNEILWFVGFRIPEMVFIRIFEFAVRSHGCA